MYFEMESWNFTDWHSPFMGLLWRALYLSTDRFFSLYLFQMSWYFMFFHLLTNMLSKKIVTLMAIACSVLLVFIPQYLMKDVHMTLSWCSALIMMLAYERERKIIYHWTAFIFIAYGLLLRPHALPAVWPILLLWMDAFHFFKQRRVLKYFSTFILSCIIFVFYYLILHGVLHAKPSYFTYKYRLADVLGISIMSGENFMPPCVTNSTYYDQKKIEEMYTPATNDNIYFDGNSMFPPASAETDACVKEAWIKAIKTHPFIYLKSRAIGYIYYLKIVNRVPLKEYWNVMIFVTKNNYIPIDDHHTPLTTKLIEKWKLLEHIFFYDPWLWILLNSSLVVLFFKKYRKEKLFSYKLQIALQLSCILYQLSLFPFYQIDLDFRFSYLNVLCFFTSLFFYLDSIKKTTLVKDSENNNY